MAVVSVMTISPIVTSPDAPPMASGLTHIYRRATSRRQREEDDLRQVVDLCALGGALNGFGAFNGCGL